MAPTAPVRRRNAPRSLSLLCLAAAAHLRWSPSSSFAAPSAARLTTGRICGQSATHTGAGVPANRPKIARKEGAGAAPRAPPGWTAEAKDRVLTVAAFPFALVPLWAQLVTAEQDMQFKSGLLGVLQRVFVGFALPLGALFLFVPLWFMWTLQIGAALLNQVTHPVRMVRGLWGNRGPLALVAALAAAVAGLYTAGYTWVPQAVGGLLGLYALMSLNEYAYHRYCQHLGMNKMDLYRWLRPRYGLKTYRGDGHVEHHRETLDDMSLDIRSHDVLDADPYRGTSFNWMATLSMTLGVLPQAVIVLRWMAGWPWLAVGTVFPAAMMLHALIWNALHPKMHGLPSVPLSHGAPSAIFEWANNSRIFTYLRENHEGHHRIDGAHGNYNVCCPLADHLFGTHVGRIPAQATA